MRIAIHQPNFIAWLPFFYKMASVDKFVVLGNVQFEKNGYQNRYKLSNGKWVTKPVSGGMSEIVEKCYADGRPLFSLNMLWIFAIKSTLDIDTPIVTDYPTSLRGTGRLIDLIKHYGGTVYVTNPEAKDKYLDEDMMRSAGIDIEYCKVPKNLNIHVFEAFEKWGIEGTIKQLPRVKSEKSSSIL